MIEDAELPAVEFELPAVEQVAFVVEDLEDGMTRFDRVFGVDTWSVFNFEPPRLTETTYYGEPADYAMKLALTTHNGTNLELVEPVSGPSLFADHLDEHGEGLHHVGCFDVDDHRSVVRAFEDAGIPVIQSGKFYKEPDGPLASAYWYFDTPTALNGVHFEIVERHEKPEPDAVYQSGT
jgi:hypothetical protein